MTQQVQTHAPHRNCEPDNSSVKQSNRYITYLSIWIHWQHIMCSAGHMGHDVACTAMAWTR